MALIWSWGVGEESPTLLESMGFDCSSTSTNSIEPRQTYQYRPSGGAARWSWALDHNAWVTPPVGAKPTNAMGCLTTAFFAEPGTGPWNNTTLLNIYGGNSGRNIYVQVTSGGALKLFVDNTYKATSTSTWQWSGQWHQVTLKYDMSADPWKGSVWVDGVQAIAEQTDARVAEPSGATISFTMGQGFVNADRATYIGQCIIYDNYTDPAENVRFVSRIAPDTDSSTTGTWASTGPNNHSVLGSDPFDAATYTENSGPPSAGDDVITTFAGNLGVALGGVPPSVDGVTVHSFSTGLANTARAEVGDQAGATTTPGVTSTMSNTTTYATATAPTKPSGGAWTATDTPKAKYEIISV